MKNSFITTIFIFLFSLASNAQLGLVIVDMQDFFTKQNSTQYLPSNVLKYAKVIQRQRHLISVAKKGLIPIIVVSVYTQSKDYGPTSKWITNAVGDYKYAYTHTKEVNSFLNQDRIESKFFKERLEKLKISELLIVGANGGACVICSVADTLRNKIPVHLDATATIDFRSKFFHYPYVMNLDKLKNKVSFAENILKQYKTKAESERFIVNAANDNLRRLGIVEEIESKYCSSRYNSKG
ncbi:MAG: isochorismatase family protein [Bdellovibrionales bacterium]